MPDDAATFFPQYTAMVFRLMHRRGEGTDWLRSLIFHLDSEISKLPQKKQYQLLGVAQGLGMVPGPTEKEEKK